MISPAFRPPAQTTARVGITVPSASVTPSARTSVTPTPRCSWTPILVRRALVYSCDFTENAFRTVGIMSTKWTRHRPASSGEKYFGTTNFTFSAMAPAVSTPVGPPPTTTTSTEPPDSRSASSSRWVSLAPSRVASVTE